MHAPHVRRDPQFLCGGCLSVTYCGSQCQQTHWAHHQRECRIIRDALFVGAKRDRSEEEEEEESERVVRPKQQPLTLDLERLDPNVLNVLRGFLSRKDEMNLAVSSRELLRKLRIVWVSNVTWVVHDLSFFEGWTENDWRRGIRKITFDDDFNQSVDWLPPNLTHLTFGYGFNQSVDRLPPNLTHLKFGRNFNQPVDLNLFPNLVTISFVRSDQQRHLLLGLDQRPNLIVSSTAY